jgi:alkanesulfonate monooxygenase SsuD/methylene tetrahydromethanopterin reductase-like flavin-dependent oxidoreductase (luciferase family)
MPYFGLPFYRAMIERSGYAGDIEAYDAAGGDFEAMQSAVSAGFLQQLTAVGDQQAVREGIERYRRAGASTPCVGPITGADFNATLEAAIG